MWRGQRAPGAPAQAGRHERNAPSQPGHERRLKVVENHIQELQLRQRRLEVWPGKICAAAARDTACGMA